MENYGGERDSSPDCEEDMEVYRLMVTSLQRTKPKAREAFHYIHKIKRRFSQEPDKVKQFLDIVEDHRRAQRLPAEVRPNAYDLFARISNLFEEDHRDLLQEFRMTFMPPTSGTSGTCGTSGPGGSSGTGGTSGTGGASGTGSTSSLSGSSGTSSNTPPPS